MRRILVTYATMAGSTREVAETVAEQLAEQGVQVDVLPIGAVAQLAAYDAVVLGGPMIVGWHRGARRFLKRNRAALQSTPLAVFVTCISLTQTGTTNVGGVPLSIDERLPKPPAVAGRLSFAERHTCPENYIRPILRAGGESKPVSIGVFGGRLEYGRLKWWAVLFAMVIIRARAGDRRNWTAIRSWAAGLPAAFGLELSYAAADDGVGSEPRQAIQAGR